MNTDRTAIAGLLLPYFPTMDKATSEEWHGFLNSQTGLDVGIDEPNRDAFDRWRQALAQQGLPVWTYSPERIAAIKQRGDELKAIEEDRRAKLGKTLEALAKEAPDVPAKDLIRGR